MKKEALIMAYMAAYFDKWSAAFSFMYVYNKNWAPKEPDPTRQELLDNIREEMDEKTLNTVVAILAEADKWWFKND